MSKKSWTKSRPGSVARDQRLSEFKNARTALEGVVKGLEGAVRTIRVDGAIVEDRVLVEVPQREEQTLDGHLKTMNGNGPVANVAAWKDAGKGVTADQVIGKKTSARGTVSRLVTLRSTGTQPV